MPSLPGTFDVRGATVAIVGGLGFRGFEGLGFSTLVLQDLEFLAFGCINLCFRGCGMKGMYCFGFCDSGCRVYLAWGK